jgi:DNA repair protein RadC
VDTRNRLHGEREIFRGTLNRAAVEPREIQAEAPPTKLTLRRRIT